VSYRYRFTPKAAAELKQELAYSVEHWGKSHANAYRKGLMDAILRIAENPEAYPERPYIGEGYRLVRYKGNRILYTINPHDRCVEIMGVPSVHRQIGQT
jgi:plasmid stabilization system protein ParE